MDESQTTTWNNRYWEWLNFVLGVLKAQAAGNSLSVGPSSEPLSPPAVGMFSSHRPKVVLCAPHPDDETVMGALPLRARLEAGAQVTNVAVTMGSNASQRARRLRELESACRVLGFDLVVARHPEGLEDVNLNHRRKHVEAWAAKVETLREIFGREKPDAVLAPHAEDYHPAHIGTHYLAVDALGEHLERNPRDSVLLIETEYWHPLAEPNLMLGVTPDLEAILVMALAEHGGEVARNPYHLRHPARMIDNVRRGSEVVGGAGAAGLPFDFAELYRVNFMKGREVIAPRPGGLIVGPREKIHFPALADWFRPETV